MDLVIVESPTKARKLTQYLGGNYVVEASVGHVRDLPKKKLGIDLDNNFEPTYEVDPEKQKVISRLRDLASQAETIYLATDPDREGEAIAWHIKSLLEEKTSKKSSKGQGTGKDGVHLKFVRSTFHEITKTAVQAAIDHPGELAMPLVDAQQARRVVDRLVGYQVSPVLWKKVRRGLSAGRVQSVALRMIVEREREIEAFKPEEYWEVDVLVSTVVEHLEKNNLTAAEWLKVAPADMLVARLIEVEGKKYEPKTKDDVEPWTNQLKTATYTVKEVEKKKRERVSLPPFTTSTLQQGAATRLGFTSKQTMTLAQQLYEEGLITYHRTDSVNLSTQSLDMAREYIHHHYGAQYTPAQPRLFSQKSKNAQEAHEAIRVTDVNVGWSGLTSRSAKFTGNHEKLYELIWRRFLASQMSSAVYDQTSILITAAGSANTFTLRSSGSILTFDGWMKLFPASEDTLLPPVEANQKLNFADLNAAQKFTQPPPRYNDASLVKELEKRGIGRPSTYASIISVIVDRGYVERMDKRFVASTIGMTVADFLMQHFPVFMEYDFTAEMEEDLDRISRGEKEWRKVVKAFYGPLEKVIAQVTEAAERVQIPVEETGETCPKCGETAGGKIVIRSGRFGKFKSCNRFPECDFTENIVDKVEGMVCPLCGQGDVIIKNSRWGKPFYGCGRYPDCDWASWKKPEPGQKVTAAEWKVMQAERKAKMEAKKAAQAPKPAKKTAKPKKATKRAKKS